VYCQRTQLNDPSQGSNPDRIIQRRVHYPWGHHASLLTLQQSIKRSMYSVWTILLSFYCTYSAVYLSVMQSHHWQGVCFGLIGGFSVADFNIICNRLSHSTGNHLDTIHEQVNLTLICKRSLQLSIISPIKHLHWLVYADVRNLKTYVTYFIHFYPFIRPEISFSLVAHY